MDASGNGICHCSPGCAWSLCHPVHLYVVCRFFRRDCDGQPLLMRLGGNVSECGGQALVTENPGVQVLDCEDEALKADTTTEIVVTILSTPEADVRCIIESSVPSEATVETRAVTFKKGSPLRSSESVLVTGVKDTVVGDDMQFVISARCSSKDLRFEGAAAEASAYTNDVLLPFVTKITPALSPFVGILVKVSGNGLDMDTETEVEVAGIRVSGGPIHRTILHDEEKGQLFEVEFVNQTMATEWEFEASNGYREERDPQSWKIWQLSQQSQRRRQKAFASVASGVYCCIEIIGPSANSTGQRG